MQREHVLRRYLLFALGGKAGGDFRLRPTSRMFHEKAEHLAAGVGAARLRV